jgi:penicillin-binding protein 2
VIESSQRIQYRQGLRLRQKVAGTLLVLVLGALVLRLYHLQVLRGAHYRELSENNRLAFIRTGAPRGLIYDRHYDRERRPLVSNRAGFGVSVILEDVRDLPGTVAMLGDNLALEREEILQALKRVGRYRQFEPVRLSGEIRRDQAAVLEMLRYQYPGVVIGIESRRSYPHGGLGAHILGYLGEANRDELETPRFPSIRTGEMVGKTGLEKTYNDLLRGMDGGQEIEVDSHGRRLRILNEQPPLPGYDLVLTLDLDLQQAAEEALGGTRGSVVAMDSRTGEILALVSHPAYDPNLFSAGISREEWLALVSEEKGRPLQNRSLQNQYPPGSVFKLVTALAALQEGTITPETAFPCAGGVQLGDRYFRCWKKGGHGTVALHQALVHSCDSYFYRVGERLGIDAIARYARDLGLGRKTGIEIPGEAQGLVPDRAWKQKVKGEPWYRGETFSAAIGQGYNLMTPLQMAVMVSAVGNGGSVLRPYLVSRVVAPDGRTVRSRGPHEVNRADILPGHFDVVKRGLWGVVNQGGTGVRARLEEVQVAGKTGTAQVLSMRQEDEESDQSGYPIHLRDHAWFACFAPYPDPEITVVVLMEHGGHGGAVSAPVARSVLARHFALKAERAARGEGRDSGADRPAARPLL